jgi:hypothetical protein
VEGKEGGWKGGREVRKEGGKEGKGGREEGREGRKARGMGKEGW